jgi:hypothetical protein
VRTGFIYHPNEFWRRRLDRKINPSEFDIASEDRIDLAKQMGARKSAGYWEEHLLRYIILEP